MFSHQHTDGLHLVAQFVGKFCHLDKYVCFQTNLYVRSIFSSLCDEDCKAPIATCDIITLNLVMDSRNEV